MTSPSRNAAKFVMTLGAASSLLFALLYPDPRSEVQAEDRLEALHDFDPSKVKPRYLVTYMNSTHSHDPLVPAQATVVSVTNLTREVCNVSVEWFLGDDRPICTTNFALNAAFSATFCTRDLPIFVSCNVICDPSLEFGQGTGIVGADCKKIGVSSRVYVIEGVPEDENDLLAISDSKIVRVDVGNQGD
jgi:hypothetical protein